MKKQTLLGAAALTTLAVAGAANASTLTAGAVLPAANANIIAPRVVASEVTLDATTSKGIVGLVLTPSASAILPSGNALLKVSLTGGAKFGTDVTAGAVVKNGACDPTTVISTGGGAGTSTVTFLVSTLGGCTNALPIHLAIPVQVTSTSAVNVETNLTTEAGTPIDGGSSTTFVAGTGGAADTNLISFAKAFSVKYVADTVVTKALLPDFKTLSGDVALGTAEIKVDTNAYKGLNSAATKAVAGDVTDAKFTVVGDLSTVDIKVGGTAVDSTTGITNIATPGAVIVPIIAAIKTPVAPQVTPYAIKGSNYTVETALTLASGYNAQPAFGPTAIQSITRDGSSYLLPWVASGSLATTSTSNTVVRIANTGAATGAVSVELLTSSAGVPASTTLVPVATSIAKGGELVLTSATFEGKLGNFGRGDIRVTVEGQPQNLIVRRFVQSTVNGALSEVSLGRSATGAEPQN